MGQKGWISPWAFWYPDEGVYKIANPDGDSPTWTFPAGTGTILLSTMPTDFSGTFLSDVMDFANVVINHTGSGGPCFIRAGTYGAPVTHADEDQSGMIRMYGNTTANGSSYDRGIFMCLQTHGTKGIYPIAALAEVHEQSGAGPAVAAAGQFIADMITATSKVAARSGVGWANFYGAGCKVASRVGSVASAGSVVTPLWLDTQMNGTVNGEMYAAFITTGHHNDAVFAFEETGGGGHWDYLFYFDETTYDQLPCGATRGTPNQTATCDGSLAVNVNGKVLFIPLYNAVTVT